MSAEREIVNLWLNKKGFFTISGINAGNRIVDFVAVRHIKGQSEILHLEVSCSVSTSVIADKDKYELKKLFFDPNIVRSVENCIENFFGSKLPYENVLVTNFQNINIEGVRVVQFEDVLFDFISTLDKQRYNSQTIRAMQLLKFLLLADPSKMSALISMETAHKPMTAHAKESLIKELLADSGKKVFAKPSNEQLLMDLLASSSLKNPDKLAAALEDILTKRTGNKLLKLLMQKSGVRTAIKEELSKDRKLEQYFKV